MDVEKTNKNIDAILAIWRRSRRRFVVVIVLFLVAIGPTSIGFCQVIEKPQVGTGTGSPAYSFPPLNQNGITSCTNRTGPSPNPAVGGEEVTGQFTLTLINAENRQAMVHLVVVGFRDSAGAWVNGTKPQVVEHQDIIPAVGGTPYALSYSLPTVKVIIPQTWSVWVHDAFKVEDNAAINAFKSTLPTANDHLNYRLGTVKVNPTIGVWVGAAIIILAIVALILIAGHVCHSLLGKRRHQPPRIFISHSSKDLLLADKLRSLLCEALHLRKAEVRCTSLPGSRLSVGDRTDAQLADDIRKSRVYIALLTKDSVQSQYFLIESGERGVMNASDSDHKVFPVLGPYVQPDILPGPLRALNPISTNERADISQMLTEIASLLRIPLLPPHEYEKAMSELIGHGPSM